MEQAELRHWERKCIQEESPRCTAACPLHVDVRTVCSLLGQKRWDKAWAAIARTMPLPGVLARLCDAPCRDACVRSPLGGGIEMGALERFCAERAAPVAPPRPLPSRGKTVAIIGGGMTGLCAAWEMARRGFDVTLHCQNPGGSLLDLPESQLPRDAFLREMENLATLGANIRTDVSIDSALLDALLEAHDAVFVDSDAAPLSLADLGQPDEITLGTLRAGLFASRAGETSPVMQAAAGRRAANSVERFTQGVSMVSGREQEGPCATRLYTNVEDVAPAPAIAVGSGYGEDQAHEEARRCLQCECMECVKNCEFLKHYKSYPKIYVRQVYNNESIVMGTRQANTMINSCMLCGLCETLCPEDFSMAEVCLEARRTMVRKGTMPQSAHEFALRDMAFANGDRSALARHAPGAETSEYLFFPGCQLTASAPDAVEAAYADLRQRIGSVGLMLRCCGAPAQWAGREALMDESVALLRSQWEELGRPKLVVACPTCLNILRDRLPDAEISSHWSILRALGVGGESRENTPLAINDPCGARHNPALLEDVRALLDQMHIPTVEPRLSGATTECCGYGGLLAEANPELGKAAARRRAAAADEDFVTYCAMCRDMLAKAGKRAVHLYDLLFPAGGDPGARPSPGYSARRENRARLKERLLGELWQAAGDEKPLPHESIEVRFTDEAARIMEERRILKTDIQKVLLQVRKTGRCFHNDETGHSLASFRPTVVTYWVEFEETEGGYLVHNAWSHRMRIMGGQA
jgi:Fe-S oxidoreductase